MGSKTPLPAREEDTSRKPADQGTGYAMAESAFEAMPSHLRERALDELLRAEFIAPVYYNIFVERLFLRQAPPPGGPLCRRQPEGIRTLDTGFPV